jgi:hypothetical protein
VRRCPFLVGTDPAAVSSHVGGQDRCQLASARSHGTGNPPCRAESSPQGLRSVHT